MGFRNLMIKSEYRTFEDNIITDFFIPTLSNAILYRRAVGFFSSTALIEISKGILGLVKHKGKIQLIVSPRLQEEDIEAISMGYEQRSKVIENSLLREFKEPINLYEEERLNLLANLVADGILEIKVAFTMKPNGIGIYHEKLGLVYDEEGQIIAFTGSMNETNTAFSYNYEAIDVFCSWCIDSERVNLKKQAFESLWNDYEPNVSVLKFPEAVNNKLLQYKKEEINYDLDQKELLTSNIEISCTIEAEVPYVPSDLELYDYQIQAIDNWEKENFRGIFDMATGTGKTYTGLAAIVRLSHHLQNQLVVVIVCPYQHLVEQWSVDVEYFNMKPIIAYSTSKQKNWKQKLKDAVIDYNVGIKKRFAMVTTNATFTSKYVQEQLNKIEGDIVLLVDEAHNFGAERLCKYLSDRFEYRLALSATLERHNDEVGTVKLLNYFGEKCIEYPLSRAIEEGKLTPYYYYPVVTYLTEDERDRYQEITKKIIKSCKKGKDGRLKMSKYSELLLMERSRIIAGAMQKIGKLYEIIMPYKNDRHMLVYCGATTIRDSTYTEGVIEEYEARQIDVVTKLLGIELEMDVSKFTSEENAEEREILKYEFAKGENIQALVAIRCLDEGVNIPDIKTAFILASSTNPKEYIQRRGRVLRKATGKNRAIIYDFVTLPRPLDEVSYLEDSEIKMDISLVKKEILRVKDFASLAENSSVADMLIENIEEVYGMNVYGGEVNELW